jgi:hypothetical protein
MFHRPLAVLLLACCAVPLAAADDAATADGAAADLVDLHLANGERARGSLLDETADTYVVHQTVLVKSGSISTDRTYAKSDVTDIVHVQDEYKLRAAKVGADASAEAHAGLAMWCLDEGMTDAADQQAHLALAKDATNAHAQAVLVGLTYVDDHGTWVKAADYLTAHGLAVYNGVVMAQDQRDGLVELARQHAADRLEADRLQSAADAITTAIANDQGAIASTTRELADLDRRVGVDQATIAAVVTAKKALDAANGTAPKNGKKTSTKNNAANSPSAAVQDAQRSAQQAYDDAVAAGQQAQADLIDAESRQTSATAEQKRAQADLDVEQPKQASATSDAETAAAKAEKSGKAFTDAFAAVIPPSDLPPQFSKK